MNFGIYDIYNKFHCPKCNTIVKSTGKTVWRYPFLKRQLECQNNKCTVKTFYTWETTVDLENLLEGLSKTTT